MEILFLSDILSCSGHVRINLPIIALVIIFFGTITYRRMMLGLEDALERQYNDDVDILKVLQCFFFSNLLSKLLTKDVIKNVCDVIILI